MKMRFTADAPEVLMRDLAECYAKGNYTTDEYFETLEAVANDGHAQPRPQDMTLGEIMAEMQKLINKANYASNRQ